MVHTHTHTLPQEGEAIKVLDRWGEDEDERNESEMRMKMRWRLLNQDAKRGTQKKKERANTNTNTPGPERANLWKGKWREKRRPTDTEQDQRRGGGDGNAWIQPNKAKTYAYLGTHRTRPTWGGKNAWNRGPNGEIVGEQKQVERTQFKPRGSCVNPTRVRCQVKSCHVGPKYPLLVP